MPTTLRNTLATAVLALVFGFLGAGLWSFSGLGDNRTRDYLMSNPEILPEMAKAYQRKEASKRLADLGKELYAPFNGAVLGNPNGSKVLVEFTDYNCPYCKSSLADVERLVAEDKDVKVVIREWPIFEGSELSSRMALAAAMQGKYKAFHDAMFELAPATEESVEEAARRAGLDLEKARADAESEAVTVELMRNQSFAQSLGFDGTPAWVTSDQALNGAVGYDALKEALDEAETAEGS